VPEASSAPSRPEAYLSAQAVSTGYGRTTVVHGASIGVGLGEVALVMGPNGAGKSTLIKAITGHLPLLEGRLSLAGRDISSARPESRAAMGIGYVPQTQDVFGPLTVAENLAMGGYRLPKAEAAARIARLYEQFPRLATLRGRRARTLSGGERKLVAVGRALVAEPKVLILDEPTASLAPLVASQILSDVVAPTAARGHAVLLIEQRVRLALDVASWGYVLREGRVVRDLPAAELRAMPDLSTLFLGERVPRADGRGRPAGRPGG
jgi:branched-chain amino acid transport system ATP-binding protein